MKKTGTYIQYLLAALIFLAGILYALFYTSDNLKYGLILSQKKLLLDALFNTLYISIISLLLSMFFGFVLFLMMKSRIPFVYAIAAIFKELVMGTPLLVMVFMAVYLIGEVVQKTSKMSLGILALTMYMSPYMANSYETAVAVVDEEQYMVMEYYNFTGFQRYRYVIIPQMIGPMIPSAINNLSSIIKGSALLKIVSVSEISYVISVISAKNWAAIEGYYVMWIAYLTVTIPLSLLARFVGKKVLK